MKIVRDDLEPGILLSECPLGSVVSYASRGPVGTLYLVAYDPRERGGKRLLVQLTDGVLRIPYEGKLPRFIIRDAKLVVDGADEVEMTLAPLRPDYFAADFAKIDATPVFSDSWWPQSPSPHAQNGPLPYPYTYTYPFAGAFWLNGSYPGREVTHCGEYCGWTICNRPAYHLGPCFRIVEYPKL